MIWLDLICLYVVYKGTEGSLAKIDVIQKSLFVCKVNVYSNTHINYCLLL